MGGPTAQLGPRHPTVVVSRSHTIAHTYTHNFLTFIGRCIANIFAAYNQQDATFHNLFVSVRRSTWFIRFFRPSTGTQHCTYGVKYWADKYLTLYVQFWAHVDGRKTRLNHVERLTEMNKSCNVASCRLYAANIYRHVREDSLERVPAHRRGHRRKICPLINSESENKWREAIVE